jgi:hypothetical protein
MKRRWVAGFALVVAAVDVSPSSYADQVFAAGMGTIFCGAFNIAIQYDKSEGTEETFFVWAQGFMSGLNVGAPPGINVRLVPEQFNSDRQKAFLRDYCAKNPNNKLHDGVRALYFKLHDLSQ